jgi:hypothetical protein
VGPEKKDEPMRRRPDNTNLLLESGVGLGISRKGRGSVGWEILGQRGDGGSCLADVSLSDRFFGVGPHYGTNDSPLSNVQFAGATRRANFCV